MPPPSFSFSGFTFVSHCACDTAVVRQFWADMDAYVTTGMEEGTHISARPPVIVRSQVFHDGDDVEQPMFCNGVVEEASNGLWLVPQGGYQCTVIMQSECVFGAISFSASRMSA